MHQAGHHSVLTHTLSLSFVGYFDAGV